MQMLADAMRGRGHIFEIWRRAFAERRRHTHYRDVAVSHPRHVIARLQLACRDQPRNQLGGNVADVTLPFGQRANLERVDIEADGGETGFGESGGQRQAGIAHAEHADNRAMIAEAPFELLRDRHRYGGALLVRVAMVERFAHFKPVAHFERYVAAMELVRGVRAGRLRSRLADTIRGCGWL